MENKFHFCKRKAGCCPTMTISDSEVLLGGEEEGLTKWSKEQTLDFIEFIKSIGDEEWKKLLG